MNKRVVAVCDACVLYPVLLRGLLVRLAQAGLYQARWTDAILEELARSIKKNRLAVDAESLRRMCEGLNKRVKNALIRGFEHWITSVKLPDPNDRHVVAAAIHSKSTLIVTFNMKDFPAESLLQWNIEAVHPDQFLLALLDSHAETVVSILASHRLGLRKPSFTTDGYLDALYSLGLTDTVEVLREKKFML